MEIPKHVVNLIVSQEWAIDLGYGLSELNKFLFNLEAGVDYAELRKQSSKIEFFSNYNPLNGVEDFSSSLPEGTVAKLNLTGVMRLEDGMCSQGIKSLSQDFYRAYGDTNIKAILLDVNSGGGDPQAGAELNATIGDRNKPVIVRTSFAGSAAVMGILQADEIIAASEFAKIGSIGAYSSISKEMLDYYKENVVEIYSDLSADKNAEFRDAVEGKYEKLKASLNSLAKNFQDHVTRYRPLSGSAETIAETLRGGMFEAVDAKNRGLVDSIGTQNYALKRVLSYIK